MPDDDARRQELERDLATSRRVRRRVVAFGVAGIALAIALRLGGAGPTAFLAVALSAIVIAGAGAWITWAHIQDFEKELDARRRASARSRSTRRR